MSVQTYFVRVPETELHRLQTDVRLIVPFFIYQKPEDDALTNYPTTQEKLVRIRAAILQSAGVEEHELTSYPNLSIGKYWQAIHVLLNGIDTLKSRKRSLFPLGHVIEGGTKLGKKEVGYGTPRFLTAQQVREVADALALLPPEVLRRRFDPKAFDEADIYGRGGDWTETIESVLITYAELIAFFTAAVQEGQAIIRWAS